MTSQPEEYRRMDDLVDENGEPVSPAHKHISDRLKAVEDGIAERNLEERLEQHMTEDHEVIKSCLDGVQKGQEALAAALLGPRLEADFDGQIRRDEDQALGNRMEKLEGGVDDLHEKFDNGGVHTAAGISKSQNTAIWTAAIGGFALILGRIIDLLANLF